LRKQDINDEITGKVSYPCSYTSKELASEIRKYIRSARVENRLHVIITDVVIINDEIAFCFSAEHIKKSFSCRKLFKPKRFSIVEAIDISDNLHIFMNEKLKRINRYYGTGYKLKFIKQTMKEGDKQILICLLAEKSL